jgi:hypothetical protein
MLNNIIKGFGFFLNDRNKKKSLIIIWEFLCLWIKNKNFPMYYFSRFLYRKEYVNYKDYISTKDYNKLINSNRIQNELFVNILQNKLLFALFCEKNDLPAPKLLGYNSNNYFFKNKKQITLKSNSELVHFFIQIFEENTIDRIFVKSIYTKGGKGIFLLSRETLKNQVADIQNELLSGSFIFQECLIQHQDINDIYPTSINTLRIDICIDNNNKAHLLGAVMRFGVAGNVIDNRSKGGFFVSINESQGCLMKKGYKQMGFNGAELLQHPDSGFEFEGFKIPYFDESLSLAINMSHMIPNKLIGWDIAITPNGPLIIEGNHDTNITMTEVRNQGYMKNPLILELIKES